MRKSLFCHIVQEFCTVGRVGGNDMILFVSILFALAESALYNTVIKTFITPSDRYLLIQRRNFHIIKGSLSFLFNLLTEPHLNKEKSGRAIFRGALPRTLASYLPLRPLSFLQDLPLCEVLEEIVHGFEQLNIILVMTIDDCSIFLIISVAIERYLAVCRPHHYREIQTDSSR